MALTALSGEIEEAPRIHTGISELDRALGGGFVRGSAVLIGGDPGIGKSTLLMQAAAALSRRGHRDHLCLGRRGGRPGAAAGATPAGAPTPMSLLAAETNVEDILATLAEGKRPDLVIIDSIQTLWSDLAESAPGTVTQVRTGVQAMIRFAKQTGAAMVLVGHVTKDGQIAGPRVVEHMVDAVLYFEGDRGHHYRILRTVKNRFGPTDEIGVFEMSDKGLREVANPSELFLGERNAKSPGAAVFAGMEGTRPMLVEVQALVAPTSLGTPRRAVVGWDSARLSMILAVLEAHCGVRLGQHDVYLNIAGGYRISEPAADLAVALGPGFLARRYCPSGRLCLFRRSQPVGRRPAGFAYCASASKKPRSWGFLQRCCPRGQPNCRRAPAVAGARSRACRTWSHGLPGRKARCDVWKTRFDPFIACIGDAIGSTQ